MNAYRFLSDAELDAHEKGRVDRILNTKIKLLKQEEDLKEVRREQQKRDKKGEK